MDLRASSRLPIVRRAKTREEREAIYRFRYRVYHEEFGRLLGRPDHARRWVCDDDDELATTTLLYIREADEITATVRLRHWSAGDIPHHTRQELSMDRIPDIDRRNTAEIERLMVRSGRRGRLQVAALVRASYELLVGEHGSELVFCYCSPGLTHFYRRIAMRPYGGRLVAAPDGVMIPMVSITSDADYYRRVGSYLAPMVERFYGPGKQPETDLRPFADIFAESGVELESHRVQNLAAAYLSSPDGSSRSCVLSSLAEEERREVLSAGLVFDVDAGAMVTRKGFREDELYLVLDGTFALQDQPTATEITVGGHFGEQSLLHADGRRRSTVYAKTAGRLLVLRGRCVRKLLRRRPELAVALGSLPLSRLREPIEPGSRQGL